MLSILPPNMVPRIEGSLANRLNELLGSLNAIEQLRKRVRLCQILSFAGILGISRVFHAGVANFHAWTSVLDAGTGQWQVFSIRKTTGEGFTIGPSGLAKKGVNMGADKGGVRDNTRDGGHDAKPDQRAHSGSPGDRQDIPSHIDRLVDKERASERGQALPLNEAERAELGSWRQFPNDEDRRYRELARRELLGPPYGKGPKLSAEEQADLHSKKQFPNNSDRRYRELARRELLGPPYGKGPKLSAEEQADLDRKKKEIEAPKR
jgi:hypothetical protein